MVFNTALTRDLGLTVPVIQGGMQWVGTPALASAVSNAGGLGIITALTQPSPQALGEAIRKCNSMLRPGVAKRSKYGGVAVNLTLLPSIKPPDYEGYARAALDAGIRIFETAGNNPGPIIKLAKEHGAYVIHKCTTIRHALSAQKLGVDMLSIDGFECAGHPGEDDIGGLVLMARAYEDLKVPFVSSGGIANGQGLAASLALGAQGANMGTRFMCTTEAEIHQNVKEVMVKSDERNTIHIFRTLRNTARVFKNKVAIEVVEREARGAKFEEIQPLVSGQRGKKVYEDGDIDAGIWSCGISVGLIHDIPSCDELVKKIGSDAEEHINRMAGLVASTLSKKQHWDLFARRPSPSCPHCAAVAPLNDWLIALIAEVPPPFFAPFPLALASVRAEMPARRRPSGTTAPLPRVQQRRVVAQPAVNEYKGYLPKDPNEVVAQESIEDLNREYFWERYVSCRKPVVIDGLVQDEGWQGERWKDLSFLREIAGSTLVKIEPVDAVRDQFGTGSKRKTVPLSTFLDMLEDAEQAGKWYMTTQYEEEEGSDDDDDDDDDDLLERWCEKRLNGCTDEACDLEIDEQLLSSFKVDVSLPAPTSSLAHLFPLPGAEIMGDLVLQQCNLWMGNGKSGKSSGLHHDFHDNLYMLLSGRKRFLIWPPLAHPWLEPVGKVETVHCNGLIEYDVPHQPPLQADGLTRLDSATWLFRARLRALLEADERAARQTGEGNVDMKLRKGKGKQTADQEMALQRLREAKLELRLLQIDEDYDDDSEVSSSSSAGDDTWSNHFDHDSDSNEEEEKKTSDRKTRPSDDDEEEDEEDPVSAEWPVRVKKSSNGKRAQSSEPESDETNGSDDSGKLGAERLKRQKRSSGKLVIPAGGLPGGLRGSLQDLEGELDDSSDEFADEDGDDVNGLYLIEPGGEGQSDDEEQNLMMTVEMRNTVLARMRAMAQGRTPSDDDSDNDEMSGSSGDSDVEAGKMDLKPEEKGATSPISESDSDSGSDSSWPSMDSGALEDGEAALEQLAQMQNAKEGGTSGADEGDDDPRSFSRISPRAMHWYFGKPFDPAVNVPPQLEPAHNNQAHLVPRQGCPPPMEIHLRAGQMLYLPASWYHEVTSYTDPEEKTGVHMALNYWFHPPTAVRRPTHSPAHARGGSTTRCNGPDSTRPYRDVEVWDEIRRCVNRKVDAIRRRAATAAASQAQ